MIELSYEEFLKIAWQGWGEPKDAPIYRGIYINLVFAKIIKQKGDLPPKDPPSIEDRLGYLEKRIKVLEESRYSQ